MVGLLCSEKLVFVRSSTSRADFDWQSEYSLFPLSAPVCPPYSQTEGAKRWRLYAPPLASDVLASTSSGNYEQAAIGKAFADVTLETGDLLYLPRGTIHQAMCAGEQHSMHATISTAQVRSGGRFCLGPCRFCAASVLNSRLECIHSR
jgi:hypothetical protein